MADPRPGDSVSSAKNSGHHVGMYDNTIRTSTGSVVTSASGKPLVAEGGSIVEKRN